MKETTQERLVCSDAVVVFGAGGRKRDKPRESRRAGVTEHQMLTAATHRCAQLAVT